MLHLLSLAAGRVAAVCPPLSPGGRADRGGSDPPPRAGAVRRPDRPRDRVERRDRKSTRLNSSHGYISYAVFCLKKKKKINLHIVHAQVTHQQALLVEPKPYTH